MPILFYYKGFRFFFYSNEGTPLEPAHVHVEGNGKKCKIFVDSLQAVDVKGLSTAER